MCSPVADLRSIAILKPGTFTDVKGIKVTFTRADLLDVAQGYDAARAAAPIVIGHPGPDAPAHGWIGRVALEGDMLRAYPSSISSAFAQAVADGRYRKVSPQLYPPGHAANPTPGRWHLQHVGFLGAAAPAIKGLGTVAFGQAAAPGAITVTIDLAAPPPDPVSFAAPPGYAVDQRHGALHARARALQSADASLPFWEAFERARYEASIVSLAEEPAGDDGNRLLIRARAIRAADPRLTFWDAFNRARAAA